jgi:arylsulfatase A-like enzyme
VPLILNYKGKPKHGLNNSLVNTGTDILPTLLDFANIPQPDTLPGKSLKQAAEKNKPLENRPYIVVENQMVLVGKSMVKCLF